MRLDQDALEIEKRIRELEQSIFSNPPTTMEEFQHRRGSWVALTGFRSWLKERARKDPDEDE